VRVTATKTSLGLLALLGLTTLLSGCGGPRYARDTFYESGDYKLVLRSRTDVNPGYDHPATVSAVRMAHILASIDVRFDEDETKNARQPAVPVELVYPLGEHLAKALAKADPTQEVVVDARRQTRSLKLFTSEKLTSLVVAMKNDQLRIHVSRVDWDVPKNPNDRIREPDARKEFQKFKVLPSRGIVPIARQVVAVDWRQEAFRKPDAIRIRAGGRVERRTILLEEPEDEAPLDPAAAAPDLSALTPGALRELADLEEARQGGRIGEAEYLARRRKILSEGRR
jgi:hypothetical protein